MFIVGMDIAKRSHVACIIDPKGGLWSSPSPSATETDEIDALTIAKAIRFGRYKPSRVPQDKLLTLWELCRNVYTPH